MWLCTVVCSKWFTPGHWPVLELCIFYRWDTNSCSIDTFDSFLKSHNQIKKIKIWQICFARLVQICNYFSRTYFLDFKSLNYITWRGLSLCKSCNQGKHNKIKWRHFWKGCYDFQRFCNNIFHDFNNRKKDYSKM